MVNERNGEALLLGDAREKAERCRRQLISRNPDLEATVSGGTSIPTKKVYVTLHQLYSLIYNWKRIIHFGYVPTISEVQIRDS